MRLLLPVGRSGWAIAAGYLGIFSLILFPAPVSLLISIIAIIDIRKSQSSEHPMHGMGRAIFGLLMGIIGTAILVFVISHFSGCLHQNYKASNGLLGLVLKFPST